MLNYYDGWIGTRMAQDLVKEQLRLSDASADEVLPDFPRERTPSCETKDHYAKQLEKPEVLRLRNGSGLLR